MRGIGALVVLLAAASAHAGELVLANGSRLEGELANERLLVSTGGDLIEVAPETVDLLLPSEVRLKDGRVVRGTLVGGRVRLRTTLGELTIRAEELARFRAGDLAQAAASPAAPAPARPPQDPATSPVAEPEASPTSGAPASPTPSPEPARAAHPSPIPSAVPAMPGPAAAPAPATAGSGVVASVPDGVMPRPVPEPRLEVVTATPLHRDAFANATPVGEVRGGEQVTYLDAIDRRLWILNTLIFDGGHWVKVRAADGTVGWVPASTVRGMR